jgi:hypothetical protein
MIGVSSLSNRLRGMKVRPPIWIASDPLSLRTARCENPRRARGSLRISRLEGETSPPVVYFTLNFET